MTGSNETQAAAEAARTLAGAAVLSAPRGNNPTAPPGNPDCDGNRENGAQQQGGGTTEDEVVQGLEGMTAGELVKAFRRAQEERAALYGKFNRCPLPFWPGESYRGAGAHSGGGDDLRWLSNRLVERTGVFLTPSPSSNLARHVSALPH